MASEYTPNRRYPLYTDNDKPNLRDQYNGAIREIDTDMAQALSDSSAVSAALGAGFDAQHTVRMAIDSKADSSALTAETSARESADTALGNRITNELTSETSARESADTALGTRITNETSARESADTALGTRITNETNARQSADTALDARIDSLEAPKHMVVIGDSFSSTTYQPAATAWYTLVAQQLNVTPHCYAKDSSGYVHVGAGNNTFYSELELANDDTSFANNDVEWVFIYGGLNDMGTSDFEAAFGSAFKNTINRAHQLFAHARIVVMGVNSWPDKLQAVTINNSIRTQIQAEYNIYDRQDDTDVAPFAFIPMALIFGFNSMYYDMSNRHPNSVGHHYVASVVLSNLFGTSIDTPNQLAPITLYDSNNESVGTGSVQKIGQRLYKLFLTVTFAQAGALSIHDNINFIGSAGVSFNAGQPIIFGGSGGATIGFTAGGSSLNSAGNTGTGYVNILIGV